MIVIPSDTEVTTQPMVLSKELATKLNVPELAGESVDTFSGTMIYFNGSYIGSLHADGSIAKKWLHDN